MSRRRKERRQKEDHTGMAFGISGIFACAVSRPVIPKQRHCMSERLKNIFTDRQETGTIFDLHNGSHGEANRIGE
jgi:hypothetical protein